MLKRILISLILVCLILPVTPAVISVVDAQRSGRTVFIPLVKRAGSSSSGSGPAILVGVYTDGYLGQPATIANEVQAIDSWAGEKHSLVGTFIAIEDQSPEYNIPVPLGNISDAGYTPFVNLDTTRTLDAINNNSMDAAIKNMALAFKQWYDEGAKKGQRRKAFVAPLQEMNGNWVSYFSTDTSKFKRAYGHIRDIFAQNGASPAVWWTFAPNGWSDPSHPGFEQYYPGDSVVDAVAFSSYNFGHCPAASWKEWMDGSKVFAGYMDRMVAMAPSKGIIIAQTATTAYTGSGYMESVKGQWLVDSYKLLAGYRNTIGILYFNKNKECDWPFYKKDGIKVSGYISAVRESRIGYVSPSDLIARPRLLP